MPDINGMVNDLASAENGVVVFAASTGRESAFEREEWGHGAFSKALIEALSGEADVFHDGVITVASLEYAGQEAHRRPSACDFGQARHDPRLSDCRASVTCVTQGEPGPL